MQSSYQDQMPIQPWLFLAVGYLIGQTTQAPAALQNFYAFVDKALVPLYTLLVLLYLSTLILQKYLVTPRKRRLPKRAVPALKVPPIPEEGVDEEQPIDLSGAYKLVSLENFDAFLEVQGVPWALRKAAGKARPTHRITHRGSRITIRIEGIIETETTYIINGPPVEINIRGRIFRDQYAYLESGDGIKGIKKAITENYDVHVERRLSEDKRTMTLTSKAVFQDDREPVECVQIFQRCE